MVGSLPHPADFSAMAGPNDANASSAAFQMKFMVARIVKAASE